MSECSAVVMHFKQCQWAPLCSLWPYLRGNTCTASLQTITSGRNLEFAVILMQIRTYPLQQRPPLQSPLSWVLQLCVYMCALEPEKKKEKTSSHPISIMLSGLFTLISRQEAEPNALFHKHTVGRWVGVCWWKACGGPSGFDQTRTPWTQWPEVTCPLCFAVF